MFTVIIHISGSSNPISQWEAKDGCHFYFIRGHSIFYLLLAPLGRRLESKSSPLKKLSEGSKFCWPWRKNLSPLKDSRDRGEGGGGARSADKKWNIPKAVYQTTLNHDKDFILQPHPVVHNMLWFNFILDSNYIFVSF